MPTVLCAAELPAPNVHLDVQVATEAHTISGELTVTLSAGDPRLGRPLWFHLPPNRFLARDPRGARRNLSALPFEISYLAPELRDPWLPNGFSEGSIEIQSVSSETGAVLPVVFRDNPELPGGYSIRRGLMRVTPPTDGSVHSFVIEFVTRLPNRVVDGWSETAWVLSHWFPELARYHQGQWDLSVFRPSPAKYSGNVSLDRPGWLADGSGLVHRVTSGVPISIGNPQMPARLLPLVFMPSAERTESSFGTIPLIALHTPEGQRMASLSLNIARVFLGHVDSRFGLPPPHPGLAIVQADLPPDEMLTLGHVVVVSKDYSHETPLIDRVYVGTLAEALGQVWFGETVWCDEDQQAWLRHGFAGFLALDFFESLYGWDARIQTVTDWLSPRFRENYFESPVRSMIRDGEDAPLLLSLTGYPRRRSALVVIHRKAALVLRSLSYVVAPDKFAQAVGTFYRDFNGREADDAQWQQTLESVTHQDLGWFFDEWFRGTPEMDYAIADWNQRSENGQTRLAVTVTRTGTGVMPLVVRVTASDGSVQSQRIDGRKREDEVVFDLSSPAQAIDLDPDEYLLEENRRNNHSEVLYKVRPFFDWNKQREILVSLRGRAGGNAVDGNYAGVGINVHLDADNDVRFIPIYGEKTGWANYDAGWDHDHFLTPRLSLGLSAERIGGLRNEAVQLGYRHDTRDDLYVNTTIEARAEDVESVHRMDDGRDRDQSAGSTNILALTHTETLLWSSRWSNTLTLSAEHGQSSYGSDFDYTLTGLRVGQTVNFTPWHSLQLEFIRETTFGRAPLQKQPLLGDPLVLRGYPRSFRLVSEQLEAARIEYHWTVMRTVYGREIQSRRIQLILFQDIGKGWDNGESMASQPQRQDAGLGVEFDVNVADFVSFPARLEIAMPYNDPQFKATQVIFFQALSFF